MSEERPACVCVLGIGFAQFAENPGPTLGSGPWTQLEGQPGTQSVGGQPPLPLSQTGDNRGPGSKPVGQRGVPAFPWRVFVAVLGEVCSRLSGLLTSELVHV